MKNSITEWTQAAVEAVSRQRHQTVETICEKALQGGEHGVSVYDDVAFVDPAVPYGHIRYHQGRYSS